MPDADTILEFGNVGAGRAATTLAEMLGRVVWMDPPRARSVTAAQLADKLFRTDQQVAAVFVELSGAVRGIAGLMLSASAVVELLSPLVGEASAERMDSRARSAFGELGNIALCAAAGAIATLAGGVMLPSVPHVGAEEARALLTDVLPEELRSLPAYLVETDLSGKEGPLRLHFVWVPLTEPLQD
jgi:chemotaxis protein CheC